MKILVCTISGAYFISQIKALLNLNIHVDINLASSGGVIALFIYLARNKNKDQILKYCDTISAKDIFSSEGSVCSIVLTGSVYSHIHLGKSVTDLINNAQIREDFSISTYSRKKVDERIFAIRGTYGEQIPRSDWCKVMLAAISMPIIMQPVVYKLNNSVDILQDGGIAAPSPIIHFLKGKSMKNMFIVYISPDNKLTSNTVGIQDMQRQLLSACKTELTVLTLMFDITWNRIGKWTDIDGIVELPEGILHIIGEIPDTFNMYDFKVGTLSNYISKCKLKYRIYS